MRVCVCVGAWVCGCVGRWVGREGEREVVGREGEREVVGREGGERGSTQEPGCMVVAERV
jgi:hypothetical protein